MVKEVCIPSDLWLFVGRELFEMHYITQDVYISAAIEEPKMKWFLLEKIEWQNFISMLDLRSPNPIEHANETEQDLEKWANTYCLFVKESLKQLPESEHFVRKMGIADFDYVVFTDVSRTEKVLKDVDESQVRFFGKPLYYNIHTCRLAFYIHELIHIFESRLGKPIIEDILFTESLLQNELLFKYLKLKETHPKDFNLSYVE
jgi:hypothetical protein